MAIRMTIIAVLEEEIEDYLEAAPYQRTSRRKDERNGPYKRSLGTSLGQIEYLPVSRVRHDFHTKLFQRYQRRQRELDEIKPELRAIFYQGSR